MRVRVRVRIRVRVRVRVRIRVRVRVRVRVRECIDKGGISIGAIGYLQDRSTHGPGSTLFAQTHARCDDWARQFYRQGNDLV